ncbi:patatin-like phospholipase family protein [Pasteurella multocida]|uniref:PNPLA domain-containing protein n=1 Tax=Pasteurella multocida (strain Pm70) TaxID=272843 RepID=Q9CN11_PASMU|nr:patatin family protein [Pasteurella multocida]AAK02722.1 unknown [Pasteurella multocida subsp. multocida str. Pm70]APW55242.1 serine protease [Pasteurella multocida subsp. multocida str. HN07]ARA69201.1 patatin family protein [Pasteurella multocida subsp. multocida]ARA88987.1 patatin family protein [Pasteurella multocida subsp. septica]AUL53282.1 serine protease [Pasteurella multocida]
MKVGLVLEGGGMRAMFTAGVLDVFLTENVQVDGIVAVSAGVLFGVNYPAKQYGRALRYNKKYLNDKRYMGWHSLLTTGNIVNKDFAFYELPFTLDPFDAKTFRQSKIDFYATLTNVQTGEAEYVKLDDVFNEMEVLRATSAMPFVSKMVEINGQYYLDGGIADSIPLKKCQALGYDKIIVVLTRPLEYRKKPTPSWIFNLFYRDYPHLVEKLKTRYQNYNDTVEEIIRLNNNKDIFVIRPSHHLPISRIEKDVEKVQAMYDLGITDAKREMAALKAFLSR